ncbi:MAG: polysaccharide deacetylase family protein [Brevundimonas sp.]|uniref:polysaccharide deacetylase family protein n=1 Tax=Brevundimonas sp. TaxID=1871086 RepID=UPI00391DABF9
MTSKRRVVVGILAFLLLATGGYFAFERLNRPPPDEMHFFAGVRGPREASRIIEPTPTRISAFERGGPHRLAILVTDPESGWLGLVRGFRALGVPITVTGDVNRALRHKVVLVYPIVSGRTLEGPQIRALADHVRGGGTVVAFNLAGGGLEELFGVVPGPEATTRTRLRWTRTTGEAETDEIVVSGAGEVRVGSIGYQATSAEVLGRFEDGSAAVTCRTVGGRACLVGIDLGSLAQRSMNGRAEAIARRYVNGYDPSLDSLFRWVRDIYVAGEPMPWLVSSAPAGREVSILFTHDVDFGESVRNAPAFAAALAARGVRGTFFVQTKYLKDYNDSIFFDDTTVPLLSALVRDGHEIGSHTVAHSGRFEVMELGSGRERYPAYRPRVTSVDGVEGASILGELRVSKFLLERLTGAAVSSFRPGRLSYPFSLPQAMQATGYRYSSSVTANVVMTHLPFQMTDGRADGALQPIYEFPVTIEDELPPRMGDRLDAGNALIERIARDRGVAVILTHPNITDHKLRFVEGVADYWRGRAWMGTVDAFGDWWAARDALETDIVARDGRWVLVSAAGAEVRDVAVLLPKAGRRSFTLRQAAGTRRETVL